MELSHTKKLTCTSSELTGALLQSFLDGTDGSKKVSIDVIGEDSLVTSKRYILEAYLKEG